MVYIIVILVVILFLGREFYLALQQSFRRIVYLLQNKLPLDYPAPQRRFLFFKRMLDVVVASGVCVLVLPLLYIVLAPVIKLTSKGPVIFKQRRKGQYGIYFTCYKFRSMHTGCAEGKIVMGEDERVTPIGRILRRTHLDEFPQFWNVLKGEMSLIGPRPLPIVTESKLEVLPQYALRLLRPAGLSGLAQINSGRLLPPEKYLQLDIEYVKSLSWKNEWRILWKTIKFCDVTY